MPGRSRSKRCESSSGGFAALVGMSAGCWRLLRTLSAKRPPVHRRDNCSACISQARERAPSQAVPSHLPRNWLSSPDLLFYPALPNCPSQVLDIWARVRVAFPSAKIVASGFDDFVVPLLKAAGNLQLPVVSRGERWPPSGSSL